MHEQGQNRKQVLKGSMQIMMNTCEAIRENDENQVFLSLSRKKKPSNLSDLFDKFFHHADRTGNTVHSIFMLLETRLKTHGDPSNAQPLALYSEEFPKFGYFSGSSSLYGSCMVQVMLCCTDI